MNIFVYALIYRFQHFQSPGVQEFQHLAELTILNVRLIIEFAKMIPGFMKVCKEDQMNLLKVRFLTLRNSPDPPPPRKWLSVQDNF